MPVMETRTSAVPRRMGNAESGLPNVGYRPPVVATLLASLFLFALFAVLGVFGASYIVRQMSYMAADEQNSGVFGTGICGIVTLICLSAVVFFGLAIGKGFRDIRSAMHYTRGTIAERRNDARKAANWLMINPSYAGLDLEQASRITDDQRAASVDRSEIFQPRFSSPFDRRKRAEIDVSPLAPPRPGSYLSPERVVAGVEPRAAAPLAAAENADEETTAPRVVFRIDFASGVGLRPGDEVLVAHSPYLQHVYYVARLRSGEWESFRNKALI